MFHMSTICILLARYIHSGRAYPSCISVSFACTLCATYNSASHRLCTQYTGCQFDTYHEYQRFSASNTCSLAADPTLIIFTQNYDLSLCY
ncbi:uncharacterized protein F5891DRAFT_994205 [Suillus fuscotomentosus]|uniref:Secreted protein n=1 Tax=Suillus fuscotomentosus TaxID=1912939 RepID=A0AAD4ELY3_9AGAM|nr:uncharacterized protein F5891DRAFT_994205 [Suillus fuscotomentosus]KAG1908620.1 hypothetical protein F5891DRAFT_994205 [Suillus fuscotomentosus]